MKGGSQQGSSIAPKQIWQTGDEAWWEDTRAARTVIVSRRYTLGTDLAVLGVRPVVCGGQAEGRNSGQWAVPTGGTFILSNVYSNVVSSTINMPRHPDLAQSPVFVLLLPHACR